MDITDEAEKMQKAIGDINSLLSDVGDGPVDELVRLRYFFIAALRQITSGYSEITD